LPTVTSVLTPVLTATVGVGVAAALLAWRERGEPGAKPLVAMLSGQIWWSALLVFELEATTLGAKLFWADFRWVGVVVIPVAWLLFALEYTGRDQYLRPRYVVGLSVVPCATVALAVTGFGGLLYEDARLVGYQGAVLLVREPGPWFWVAAGYTYLLGLVGSIPLLGLVRSDALPFRGQSVALLVGTLAPWASNAVFLAGGVPVPGLDPTPIAFAVSGVAYLGALTRFQLLGTSPSPNWRARRLVFERMQEGAVVVDRHDYVVDMNERAGDLFDSDRSVLGRPAAALIPDYERVKSGDPTEAVTVRIGGTPYDVAASRIRDFHGRALGRVLTFHDIGEYVRQQQRLEVLNRVFRHNIRTETNIIDGYAELLADGGGEAEKVRESAMRIADTGEKARRITEMFDREAEPAEPVPLACLLEKRVKALREAYPGADVACGALPEGVRVAGVVEHVVWNVLENAVEHNDAAEPEVRVTAEADGDTVFVSVADNGPGIGDNERAVLERGSERPLEHGSGLGLWLVTWGADIAGGEVTFSDNTPRGSIVTLRLPRAGRTPESATHD
jgi:PAS domain-containing protein